MADFTIEADSVTAAESLLPPMESQDVAVREEAWGPGVRSLPMKEYHFSPGASKSKLDLIRVSPALVQWARDAPEDPEANAAVDIGSALHTLLLEPGQFEQEYVTDFSPPDNAIVTVSDLKAALEQRSIPFKPNDSKAALTANLLSICPNAPVADSLQVEWERGINGRSVLSRKDHRKLILMRDSVMAHPTARKLLETEGFTERCHYWIDEMTGELCRCRLDREIPQFQTVMDIKTTATIDRFEKSIKQYRYHVQDVFYSEGYEATQGNQPLVFVFLAVSTVLDRKKYPARLFSVTNPDRDIARLAIREDLATYAECRKTGIWHGIETVTLPIW